MAIGRALEERESEKARERRLANLRQNESATECENYALDEQGRTTDKVGEAVGMSGRTYEKARERMVAAHASSGNLPELDAGRARDKVGQAKLLNVSTWVDCPC